MPRKLLFSFSLLAVLVGFVPAFAMEMIVLNTGIRDPFTTSRQAGFIDLVIREAFLRVGVNASVIVYQNSSKSLSNANNGIDDGAALRIRGLENKFPNLIRVPEKIMDNDFVAYSLSNPVVTDSWAIMDDVSIAYIRGWQIFQNNLADHPATMQTRTAQQMFDLLDAKKVDFMLYERWQGLWRARQLGITIHVSEPPLATREMFMYLNSKHADLVPRVATALSEMKKDGSYQNIFDKTLGQLLD